MVHHKVSLESFHFGSAVVIVSLVIMGQSQSADAKSHYESVLEKQDDSKGGGYVWRGRGTVKVFHNVKLGTLYGSVQASMKATLDGTLDMKDAVALPSNTDINEWIAVNCMDYVCTVMCY